MHSTRRFTLSDLLLHIVVVIGFIISVYPIYWMFVAGTQDNEQIFGRSMYLGIGHSLSRNFSDLMSRSGINIFHSIENSLIVSLITTLVVLILASLAGYAFAIYQFRGSKTLFQMFLVSMMIPPQVTMIPMFVLMSKMGMVNTLWAIILPAIVNVFGLFLMRQSFLSFPQELLHAGRIDGLGEMRMFWTIVLPLMRPTLASLGIITFLNSWTNLLWPLIVLDDSTTFTIPVALSTLISNQSYTNYGMVMLAASIATLPMLIVFLLLRRQFVSGIMTGFYR
ncbi:MAG: carbohydrate ABC transporter permease [Alicyclobacillus shizuokensis]|nr:carbohydrate ABC transporter permease [Alicyclobacillus shizuokensis]